MCLTCDVTPAAAAPVRLRALLAEPLAQPAWDKGISPRPFTADDAGEVHALLAAGYADGGGQVGPFDDWWPALSSDAEYHPALVFVAQDETGAIVGVAQCWTGGFIKDLVVRPDRRGQGIGEALLAWVFATFAERGLQSVDLKARADNSRAIALYRRMGMDVV